MTNSFLFDSGAGQLTATVDNPANAIAGLVFAHGAGADHRHSHMNALAAAFNQNRIATFRFNFPFKEAGKSRVDSKQVSIDSLASAVAVAVDQFELPILVGGHSFGGRMATHAVAAGVIECAALVLCSFPLHPAGKPGVERAAHLPDITLPTLFLSGTRDKLADPALLQSQVDRLGRQGQIHWLDTADHAYKILKRSRQSSQDVYAEAGEVAGEFVKRVI